MSTSVARAWLLASMMYLAGEATLPVAEASQTPGFTDSGVVQELQSTGFLARIGVHPDPRPDSDTLESYLLQALRSNPQLAMRLAESRAWGESAVAAAGLPDPSLRYTEYLQSVETRVGPQQRILSASQSFPWFGTLATQGRIQDTRATGSIQSLRDDALSLIAGLKGDYFALGYLEASTRITRQHLQLMNQWESIARARYAAGRGRYADVVKAQVELGELSNRLAELEDRRRPLVAALNAHMNRPAATPVVFSEDQEQTFTSPDIDQLVATMLRNHPALGVWEARADESRLSGDLARKKGLPSFVVGLNFIQTGTAGRDGVSDSGRDAWSATVGITLPVWRGKINAASGAAALRYQQAKSGHRALENRLVAELEQVHFAYRDAIRKIELYETALLPKGRQSLGAAFDAFEVGEGSFLDLIDAQRMVLEFELSLAQSETVALTQQANLERLVGCTLEDLK